MASMRREGREGGEPGDEATLLRPPPGHEGSIPDVRSVARSSNGRMKGGGDRVCGGGEEVEFKTVVLKS